MACAWTPSPRAPAFPVIYTINTAEDVPEGRRLVSEGGGLTFILLRVKEGRAPAQAPA